MITFCVKGCSNRYTIWWKRLAFFGSLPVIRLCLSAGPRLTMEHQHHHPAAAQAPAPLAAPPAASAPPPNCGGWKSDDVSQVELDVLSPRPPHHPNQELWVRCGVTNLILLTPKVIPMCAELIYAQSGPKFVPKATHHRHGPVSAYHRPVSAWRSVVSKIFMIRFVSRLCCLRSMTKKKVESILFLECFAKLFI